MRNLKQAEALLDANADELKIMEFIIDGELYGINIAKVKEIITAMPVKPMQKSHPNIEGIFKLRDSVITVINLGTYLGLPASADPEKDIFIITTLNGQDFAFHVHTVVGIDQISWSQMKKPDKTIYGGDKGIATGIADFEGRLITILDFDRVIMEMNPDINQKFGETHEFEGRPRNQKPILVVEDSNLLAKLITESLHRSGYVNTTRMENGQDAWNYLCDLRDTSVLDEHVACIISDIEMPMMDGYHLTKLVKDDARMHHIPLVLFSSLITDEMRSKGRAFGADDQISKPEIANLVHSLDRLTAGEKQ